MKKRNSKRTDSARVRELLSDGSDLLHQLRDRDFLAEGKVIRFCHLAGPLHETRASGLMPLKTRPISLADKVGLDNSGIIDEH